MAQVASLMVGGIVVVIVMEVMADGDECGLRNWMAYIQCTTLCYEVKSCH